MPDKRLQRTREIYWDRATRVDCLYGWETIRPEWAVRLTPMTWREQLWAKVRAILDWLRP